MSDLVVHVTRTDLVIRNAIRASVVCLTVGDLPSTPSTKDLKSLTYLNRSH